jgi:hypothetical protein
MFPEDEKFWLTFMVANVVTVSARAVTVRRITSIFDLLAVVILGYSSLVLFGA